MQSEFETVNRRTKPAWRTALAVLLTLSFCSAVALAASADPLTPDITVEVGYDGHFRHGAWTPISLDVTSKSLPVQGNFVLKVPRTSLLSVEPAYLNLTIPVTQDRGTRRRLWLSLPVVSSPHPIEARFVRPADREPLYEAEIPLKASGTEEALYLILDPDGAGWEPLITAEDAPSNPRKARSAIGYASEPIEVPHDPMALLQVTAIIVRDSFPLGSLTPAQLEAIRLYVLAGGHVILTGGSSPPDIPQALASWLPGLRNGRVISLPLEGSTVPAWDTGWAEASGWRRFDGAVPVVSRSLGAGRTTVVAVDPLTSPAVAASRLNAAIALGGGNNSYTVPFPDKLTWDLVDDAPVSLSSPVATSIVAAFYVVLITTLVSWSRRKPQALLAIPLVIGLAVGVFGYTARSLREHVVYAEIQIAYGIGDGYALNRSMGLVASNAPVPREVRLRAGGVLPFPAADPREGEVSLRVAGDGVALESLDSLGVARFYHERLEPLDVHATVKGEEALLEVRNGSPHDLRHVCMVDEEGYAPLGHVSSGATVTSPYPPPEAAGSRWIPMGLRSYLERLDPWDRPSAYDIRLLALAAEHGLQDRQAPTGVRTPFIIALTGAERTLSPTPIGHSTYRRVIIIPVRSILR